MGCTDALVYRWGYGVAEDFNEAFRLYSAAAENNDINALVNVEYCLVNGEGVAKDETKVQYIQGTTTEVDLYAMHALADIYRYGTGTAESKNEAIAM